MGWLHPSRPNGTIRKLNYETKVEDNINLLHNIEAKMRMPPKTVYFHHHHHHHQR